MTWVLWRQHRAQAVVAAVLLVLFAIAVAITGVSMANTYASATRACGGSNLCIPGHLFNGDGAIIDLVHLTIAVPLVLGVFLGATLIARETEHATNVPAWTQSVTRRHWLYSKVATALGAALVISAAVSALVTWWSSTTNSLNGDRFHGAQFDTQNIAPAAFAVFGVALGMAMGALFRRTLPAIAATVLGYVAVRMVIGVYARPNYLDAVTTTTAAGVDPNVPSGSWILSQDIVEPNGQAVSGPIRVPDTCQGPTGKVNGNCLDQLGFRTVVTYHPASQYWSFQWIETGIFLALAAGLVALTIVWTLRHDA